jgi:ribosomal protein S13
MQLFQRRLAPGHLVSIGLSQVPGIGRRSAEDICARFGLGLDCRISDLTENQMKALRLWLENKERMVKALRMGKVKANSNSNSIANANANSKAKKDKKQGFKKGPFVSAPSFTVSTPSKASKASKASKISKSSKISKPWKIKDQPALVYGLLEGSLRLAQFSNIRGLIATGSYRGKRHLSNLPCRGQRTHTNARGLRHKYKSKK